MMSLTITTMMTEPVGERILTNIFVIAIIKA